jgi:hypothetical protein
VIYKIGLIYRIPLKFALDKRLSSNAKSLPKVASTVKSVETMPGIAPTAVAQESMPVRRYDFVDDADFFGKVDEIPIIQVQD